MTMAVRLHRDASSLRLEGRLDRAAATALWPQAVAAAANGVQALDLTAVDAVDSAGLALLLALAQRMDGVQVLGAPQGFADLLAAYRLSPRLAFDGDHQ